MRSRGQLPESIGWHSTTQARLGLALATARPIAQDFSKMASLLSGGQPLFPERNREKGAGSPD